MSSFLDTIVAQKQIEIVVAKAMTPQRGLVEQALRQREHKLDFAAAVKAQPVNIIAEVKRASPSKGVIDANLDAAATAVTYQKGGATAVSVLTDEQFFKGRLADLQAVRQVVDIPVLRKDFIISDYQIYEAAVNGADAVLLIVRILSDAQIREYLQICAELRLTALVEVYDKDDARRIADTEAALIGINNRDLNTFDTNVNHALEIAGLLGSRQTPVIASGICGPDDLRPYLAQNINTFLVGESLVRSGDKTGFLQKLILMP